MKHSVELWSLESGTPMLLLSWKSARKQYRPADVTVAVGENTVPFVVMLADPRSTPPVSQVAVLFAAVGPQMWNDTEPWNEGTPATLITALSLTRTFASAGAAGIDDAGASAVFVASTGAVVVDDVHSPMLPRAKSNSVAVSDWDERVSPMKTLKHLPPRPLCVRSRPPSKNSEVTRL